MKLYAVGHVYIRIELRVSYGEAGKAGLLSKLGHKRFEGKGHVQRQPTDSGYTVAVFAVELGVFAVGLGVVLGGVGVQKVQIGVPFRVVACAGRAVKIPLPVRHVVERLNTGGLVGVEEHHPAVGVLYIACVQRLKVAFTLLFQTAYVPPAAAVQLCAVLHFAAHMQQHRPVLIWRLVKETGIYGELRRVPIHLPIVVIPAGLCHIRLRLLKRGEKTPL